MTILIEPVATRYPTARCPVCGKSWGLSHDGSQAIALDGLWTQQPLDPDGWFSCDHPPQREETRFRLHRLEKPSVVDD